jgi:hypothetical protein
MVPLAALVAIPLLVPILAPLNKFFTFEEAGKIKAKMKGKTPVGFFVLLPVGKIMIRTKGQLDWFNRQRPPDSRELQMWDIVDGVENTSTLNPFTWMLKRMGAKWVGLYPWCSIYEYWLRCRTVELDNENHLTKPKKIDGLSIYVMFKKVTYYSIIEPVSKESEILSFKLEYLFDAQCENPWLAMFGQDEWFIHLCSLMDVLATKFMAQKGYAQVNAEDGDSFNTFMMAKAENIRKETGFRISNPRIFHKDAGDNEQTQRYIDSCSAEEIAQQEGLAEVAKATQRAIAREREGGGDSRYIEQVSGAQNNAYKAALENMSAAIANIVGTLDGKTTAAVLATMASALGLQYLQGKLTGQIETNHHDEENHRQGGNPQ